MDLLGEFGSIAVGGNVAKRAAQWYVGRLALIVL